MSTCRRFAALVATAASILAVGGVAVAPAAQAAPQSVTGCGPARPAVAHRAGAVVADATPLIPCGTETGYYTGENTIGVTGRGTVWFSAADWEHALVRSGDAGAHWRSLTVPGPQAEPGCSVANTPQSCSDTEQSKYNTVADAFLWVDPVTSRIFWSKTYGYAVCSSLSMSADDGATWQQVTTFACPGGDYEKIAGGPPPAGGAAPVGYPNVLYGCSNGPAPTFVVGPARVCFKSLDGGSTWASTGAPAVPSPLAPGCLQFQETQVVGPDGTLYLPLNCAALAGTNPAGLVRVAVSHDEGTTWSYAAVGTGSTGNSAQLVGGVSLAVDRAGVLYVVWPGADGQPYLAVSKDQGATWNGPISVAAPGVAQAVPAGSASGAGPHAQVAAREPGHIAIAYYGHAGADATRLNGYLTESFDATAAQPLFRTAAVNDPAHPLYVPVSSGSPPRNDYLGVTIAPDGTPWAGFVKLLSDTPDSQGYVQSTGFAGRLVPAAAATSQGAGGQASSTGLANTTSPSAEAAGATTLVAVALLLAARIGARAGRSPRRQVVGRAVSRIRRRRRAA